MTVSELIRELGKYSGDMDVEIQNDDGWNSRDIGNVYPNTVTRGLALPVPQVYTIVVLSSGMEGL